MRKKLWLPVGCLGAALVAAAPADKPPATRPTTAPTRHVPSAAEKEDFAKIQGTWECELRDEQGKVRGRIIKYIQGDKEMVVHQDVGGKVVHAHRVQFELRRSNGVRLFGFYNAEIIDGPQKGQKMANGAYVYRVDDKTFTEAMNFFVGQESAAPYIRVYRKVKDADPPLE